MSPETHYAQSGDVSIAYQVIGNGPIDLMLIPGFVSHLECAWDDPSFARFMEHLASFSRLILIDKRGTGLSDRITGIPTLEERMDDVRAVMDAVGSERAALFGVSEGGAMAILFAATYPDRALALMLYGSIARALWAPDYPHGYKVSADSETWLDRWRKEWGGPCNIDDWAPSMAHDERFRQWWAKYLRLSASPSAVINVFRMNREIDVRAVLPAIHIPTLILHRSGDRAVDIGHGKYLAHHIAGATFVELEGEDHLWWVGDSAAIVSEVEEFLTGERGAVEPDRVLATVLFTDIVDSTKRAAEIGDRRWRELLDNHNKILERLIVRFRGQVIKTTGDGIMATFDGPARALRCAVELSREVRPIGLEVRAGVHTGEIELMGKDVGGIAVHIAARVAAKAKRNEVWASSTIKDLVVGSGLKFKDQGEHGLKGLPENWRLFAVEQ